MFKKALLILLCVYLYVHYVSSEDRTEWLSKGMKAYQTLVEKLNDKNIHVEAQKWEDSKNSIPLSDESKILKKRRSF